VPGIGGFQSPWWESVSACLQRVTCVPNRVAEVMGLGAEAAAPPVGCSAAVEAALPVECSAAEAEVLPAECSEAAPLPVCSGVLADRAVARPIS
jgi:hypothetical protein